MATKTVVVLNTVRHDDDVYEAGSEVTVDEALADQWLADGTAKNPGDDDPEPMTSNNLSPVSREQESVVAGAGEGEFNTRSATKPSAEQDEGGGGQTKTAPGSRRGKTNTDETNPK